MTNDIIFTNHQAAVFIEAERLLKTQGYLGEPLFEDTYVLSKRLAEYVIHNVSTGGSGDIVGEATNAYNGVLGIATPTPTPKPQLPTSPVHEDKTQLPPKIGLGLIPKSEQPKTQSGGGSKGQTGVAVERDMIKDKEQSNRSEPDMVQNKQNGGASKG